MFVCFFLSPHFLFPGSHHPSPPLPCPPLTWLPAHGSPPSILPSLLAVTLSSPLLIRTLSSPLSSVWRQSIEGDALRPPGLVGRDNRPRLVAYCPELICDIRLACYPHSTAKYMYPQRRGVYMYARVCMCVRECVFVCTRLPVWACAHSDNTIIMRGWKFILDLGGNARAERQQLKVGPRPFQWISLLGSNYVTRIWKFCWCDCPLRLKIWISTCSGGFRRRVYRRF